MISRLLLITSLYFCLAGCRGSLNPFTRHSPEPSFDRLLELEKRAVPPNTSANDQVSRRRPGGSRATDRYSHQELDGQYHQEAATSSQKSLAKSSSGATNRYRNLPVDNVDDDDDDGDDDFFDVAADQQDLLRRTQLALRNMDRSNQSAHSQAAPAVEEGRFSAADSTVETVSFRSGETESKSSQAAKENTVAIRLTDGPEDGALNPSEQPAASSNTSPRAEEPGVGRQSSRPPIADSPVQAAGYNRYIKESVAPPVEPVMSATSMDKNPDLRWDEHLREAMRKLSSGLEDGDATGSSPKEIIRQRVALRLLALALGEREQMTDAVDGLQPAEQDYFRHQLTALMDAIDPDANPVSSRRWALVMLNQRKAHDYLATLANLEVNNLSFCTEVESFGVTERFSKYSFSPDQEVLLYCELDNFTSEKSKDGKGFETQLQGSYEIVDSAGRRVADQLLPMDSHICRNRRRDYFIAYRIYMPQNISPGSYTLRLTIEDIKGKKFGQSDVQFQIQ